jgi:hypothetical protein
MAMPSSPWLPEKFVDFYDGGPLSLNLTDARKWRDQLRKAVLVTSELVRIVFNHRAWSVIFPHCGNVYRCGSLFFSIAKWVLR